MVDTARTIDYLLDSVFQDGQVDNSINAQDLRDLIVSLRSSFGGCGMTENAVETVIASAGTPAVVLGTTTETSSSDDVTVGNNRITYTGINPKRFVITSHVSVLGASNNILIGIQIAHNGTPIGYPTKRKIATGADEGAISVVADITLNQNDYVELFAFNKTSAANIIVEDGILFMAGLVL